MKKSILTLILAFIAGITVVWSQALPGSAPRPMNCTPGPLNPVAGVPYDYSALVDPDGGADYWFATTTDQFIQNSTLTTDQEAIGGDYVQAATNYQQNGPAISPSITTITWNALGLSQVDYTLGSENPLFVAINYAADPATGCNNNFKVFRIEPINAFNVNVLNLGGDYDIGEQSCYDTVSSATYNFTTNCVDYDFGTDTLRFEVVASNFSQSYLPHFRVDGLPGVGAGATDADIYWNYTPDIVGAYNVGNVAAPGGVIIGADSVLTNEPNTSTGVSIYVFIVVHNNSYEGAVPAADLISFAAAGHNNADQPNIRWDDVNCLEEVDIYAALADPDGPDFAEHTLLGRPDIQENMPGGELFELNCTPAK